MPYTDQAAFRVMYLNSHGEEHTTTFYTTEPFSEQEEEGATRLRLAIEFYARLGRTVLSVQKLETNAYELPWHLQKLLPRPVLALVPMPKKSA
jgi:hypothetical protein